MFPVPTVSTVSREELCWEEGEENTRSWECWRQTFNSTAPSATLQTITTTFDNLGRRKKVKEDKDVALLLLQRSKEQEEQEEEEHPRREGRWKPGILNSVRSTAIMTRNYKMWKKRLGEMKTVALFIVFPLLEPFSSSVWKLIEFFVVLVTQPFSLSHLLLWKLFSAGARQSFWGFPNSIFILSAYHHKCGDRVISWANIARIAYIGKEINEIFTFARTIRQGFTISPRPKSI